MALGYIPDLQHTESDFCEYCHYGKQIVHEPLELIHMDLCNPMPKNSITFVDNATRRVWAYPLKMKDETFSTFSRGCTEVELQSGRKVKILRSDNGGEYTSVAFTKHRFEKGVRHKRPAPYTPMQNGVLEGMIRMIPERVTAMLQHAKLKTEF